MKLEFGSGALRPIAAPQLEVVRRLARESDRGRAIVRYHEPKDAVQRMLHAIEPESYVRPHCHDDPTRSEVFIALAGAALVVRFDAEGNVDERIEIRAGGPQFGCEIPPPCWHALFALDVGTVLYEVVNGPFDPADHKHYAAWAPPEDSPEAPAFLDELRRRVGLDPLGR